MMSWLLINLFAFLMAPAALLCGWGMYANSENRGNTRMRASLIGLSAPLLSFLIWIATMSISRTYGWTTSYPTIQRMTTFGVWIPVLGCGIGAFGRPRITAAVVLSSVGTVLFWFGTTLP